ncbi:acyl-CoA dehydrogenase [Roseomonas terrae]|uniref:Acyl-CoA dehydrogenase n=1 Tax=Neoroseomonas terrae TaxID=424799 RepID=A0ABS5EQ89_9PROT|nr:acyl-CoA dehydrogenase family protein [Neoroseomonas terrae]MBR0653183.1 acyl-CoA dehydrogenase [Neoroseomonas terrae]
MDLLRFDAPPVSPEAEALRQEVRTFLRAELKPGLSRDRSGTLGGFNPEFSRKVGARGWLGMTYPKQYGGHERSMLERYVVLEEMLAAGAPINAHYVADRQSGPLLLRFGNEDQKHEVVPRIARGECYFCIGMSEPDSGSDLASVRTRAVETNGGWRVNGTKIWTSYAERSHYMILFCRSADADPKDRQAGFTQFLVDMKTPGLTINPIRNLAGDTNFNEVLFQDMLLPDSAVIGKAGNAWKQLTSELALERSGPDRFLAGFKLFRTLVGQLGPDPGERARLELGRHAAHMMVLRRMSRSVAAMLQQGQDPALQGAMVKDLGTTLEQSLPDMVRQLAPVEGDPEAEDELAAALADVTQNAPSYSIRGGTREILRSTIARGLGLRQ